MLTRLAYQKQMVAANAVIFDLLSDVVQVGDNNKGRGGLFIHQIDKPAANTAELKLYLEQSDDGLNWSSGSLLGTYSSASTELQGFDFTPTSSLLRVRYEFNPDALAGADTDAAIVSFTLDIRLYRT